MPYPIIMGIRMGSLCQCTQYTENKRNHTNLTEAKYITARSNLRIGPLS